MDINTDMLQGDGVPNDRSKQLGEEQTSDCTTTRRRWQESSSLLESKAKLVMYSSLSASQWFNMTLSAIVTYDVQTSIRKREEVISSTHVVRTCVDFSIYVTV